MRVPKETLRLQASDKIGNRHIAVKRQIYCAYPQHWHNYFELEIVAAGKGIHILNGVAYPVSKGDVYLLTPIDFHEIESTSDSELFKKLTGETYLERVTSLRINYAKGLLARGLPVSDACFESGFGSLSNFLAIFKTKCDMTPSQYRLKCKKTH